MQQQYETLMMQTIQRLLNSDVTSPRRNPFNNYGHKLPVPETEYTQFKRAEFDEREAETDTGTGKVKEEQGETGAQRLDNPRN